jgi:hypothetical protein
MEMSPGFCNLRSLGKVLEHLEYGGHVCRWRGEDFMAVVVQDELVLEIPGPWWRSTRRCNPVVAMLVVLEVFFPLADDLFIGPAIGTESVAVKAILPMLLVLAVEGLGVEQDDRDLAPTVGAVAVGQEGVDGGLVFGLRM